MNERLISEFTITEQHLLLLKNLHVYRSQSEYGYRPAIDNYRPFGNSDEYSDMGDILGLGEPPVDFNELDKYMIPLDKLLEELPTALQICLCTQQFSTGKYFREDECDALGWKKK